jgi:FkbM family methyltransferase
MNVVILQLGFRPKNILDIGANKGLWSLAAYKYFNESNYYLIEASSRHAPKLHKMQVPYCISLVGSRTKVVEFYELKNPHQVSTGSSIYKENTHHFDNILPIRKVMHSLDTLLEGFPIIQFLKIDVQGAELDVLRGAGSTLKGVEVLIVEVSVLNYNKGSPLAIEVLSYLRDVGFEIFDIADTISIGKYQTLLQIDFVLVKHDSPYFKIAEEQLQE